MDLFTKVDGYCERTGPEFWAEPVNAVTNLAFVLAAALVWAVLGGKADAGARLLCLILLLIGIGSFLFHTFATGWAGLLDVLPILGFILVYLYHATRRFFGLSRRLATLAVILFVPYSAALGAGISALFGPLNGSVSYIPVPVLILIYAAALLPRDLVTARGLAIGAGILAVSLFFRTIDIASCGALPLGTHFMWHVLNAAMLGWMILVLHRHGQPAR